MLGEGNIRARNVSDVEKICVSRANFQAYSTTALLAENPCKEDLANTVVLYCAAAVVLIQVTE